MNAVDYPGLIAPPHIKPFLREIVDGKPVTDIPKGWTGIMIYHLATGQYYSTKSKDPMVYEEIVRLRKEPRWICIAIALRNMLKYNPQFQFFVLPLQARSTVEQWMADQGKRRVSTCMGEAAKTEHVLFKVYSPYNKFTRYVTAPSDTPIDKIAAQANAGLVRWLKSQTEVHKHERDTMRVALRGRATPDVTVFNSDAVVTPTNFLQGCKHSHFRAIVMEMNLRAINNFILATVTG